MPSTHTSLHFHIVFSTKDRKPTITDPARVHAFLGGVIRTLDAIPLEVGGIDDHVHLLAGLKPVHSVADVVRIVKTESSRWVHDELNERRFAWQEGYGAFTVSRSNIGAVRNYIAGQHEHHRTRSFQDEYRELLEKHEIAFDERYLW
jgi:REP element-mobilizing transposase RayT